jgi:hypothetical protein
MLKFVSVEVLVASVYFCGGGIACDVPWGLCNRCRHVTKILDLKLILNLRNTTIYGEQEMSMVRPRQQYQGRPLVGSSAFCELRSGLWKIWRSSPTRLAKCCCERSIAWHDTLHDGSQRDSSQRDSMA